MAVDGQRFMTKTQHYRKITKPLLERKRRARMNLYLDELKNLIVDSMEAQGEHITKLEKADILEMTVNYLRSHKHEIPVSAQQVNDIAAAQQRDTAAAAAGAAVTPNGLNIEKFRAGYTQAAYEVSKVFATVPGLDLKFGTHLMKHLGYQLKDIKGSSSTTMHKGYREQQQHNGAEAAAAAERHSAQSPFRYEQRAEALAKGDDVWRPW